MKKNVQIFDRDGKVVRTSQNLRGVLEHARAHGVDWATVSGFWRSPKGRLTVVFGDYSWTEVTFEDFKVATEWVKSRRSWNLDYLGDSNPYLHAWITPDHSK